MQQVNATSNVGEACPYCRLRGGRVCAPVSRTKKRRHAIAGNGTVEHRARSALCDLPCGKVARTAACAAVEFAHLFPAPKKEGTLLRAFFFWCGKRDLNPYGVNHTPLKRARLPVPPLPRATLISATCILYTIFWKSQEVFEKKLKSFFSFLIINFFDKNFKKVLTNLSRYGIISFVPVRNKKQYAGMAELADALDSGSSRGNSVEVQVLLPAPY